MTCTCVRDNEKKVAEHYSKQIGVPATAEAKNVAFVFGEAPGERAFMSYAIKADSPGYRSKNGTNVSLFFTYCPFCGVKVEEDK